MCVCGGEGGFAFPNPSSGNNTPGVFLEPSQPWVLRPGLHGAGLTTASVHTKLPPFSPQHVPPSRSQLNGFTFICLR